MAYVADPTNPNLPTGADIAGDMFLELQALKGYIQTQLSSGSNFVGVGSFRNKLLNGNFNIAQRGNNVLVFPAVPAYTLDQWLVANSGSQSLNVTQSTTNGPFANNSSLTIAQPLGGVGINLTNRIESDFCQDLVQGGSVTVSGFYKTVSLSNPVPTISLQTPTVVDNWASSVSGSTPASIALPFTSPLTINTWTFWKQTFTLPTDPTLGLALVISWPSTIAAGAVSLYNVQLEKGTAASQFELRAPQVELAMCQRFFQTGRVFLAGNGLAGVPVGTCGFPAVNMRITPVATIASNTSSNVTGLGVSSVLPAGEVQLLGTITVDGGYSINASYNITAEL